MKFSQKNNKKSAKVGTNKNKKIRFFATASLALLIGLGGVLGFTTKVDFKNNYSNNFSTSGLITTNNNDPVLFTTKEGLDIKFAESNFILSNSNLSGFAYFNTFANGTFYTWVIIGKSNSGISGSTPIDGASLYQEIDTSTPAGQSVYNEREHQRHITTLINTSLNIKSSSEIPSGCVLVLSNNIVESLLYESNVPRCPSCTAYWHSGRYSVSSIKTALDNYYNNDTFGFRNILPKITQVKLTTSYRQITGHNYTSTYSTETNISSNLFLLGSVGSDSFLWSTYLTATQATLSTDWWLRSAPDVRLNTSTWHAYAYIHAFNTSGGTTNTIVGTSLGVRPAFVLKLA